MSERAELEVMPSLKRFASGKPLEDADGARGAEEGRRVARRDAVVLAGVGERGAQVGAA